MNSIGFYIKGFKYFLPFVGTPKIKYLFITRNGFCFHSTTFPLNIGCVFFDLLVGFFGCGAGGKGNGNKYPRISDGNGPQPQLQAYPP
jgi:hypothetical protein